MKEPENITSFLTFRHFLSNLDNFDYPYKIEFKKKELDFEEAKSTVLAKLKNAIEKKLNKSERPAIMMSSGVDSVFLAALMKTITNKTIRAYTAMFSCDLEYKDSIQRAKHLELNHKVVKIKRDDYLNEKIFLKPLITQKKEPLHPNEIALAKAEKEAKKDGCDMVFCGEGADDIFGGYSN